MSKYQARMADLLNKVYSKVATETQEQPKEKTVVSTPEEKNEPESRTEGVCEKCGGEECICGSLDEEQLNELTVSMDKVYKAQKIAKKMAGNMTGAVREIEKIAKGLSDMSFVKQALAKYNEDKELDESDVYDNDRFIIVGNTAKKDNSNTPDTKNHVYAPNSKIALQLHKQGKNVYREEKILDEGTMRVSGIKYGSHNEYFKGVIKKELPNLVAKSSPNTSDVITFSGSKSDLQKLADIAKKRDYRVGDIKEELDENLDVRYDTTKKGWFDKQGKRRYLGIGQTNALMKKALDKAIKSGDWINPFKMKHGQKAEDLELQERAPRRGDWQVNSQKKDTPIRNIDHFATKKQADDFAAKVKKDGGKVDSITQLEAVEEQFTMTAIFNNGDKVKFKGKSDSDIRKQVKDYEKKNYTGLQHDGPLELEMKEELDEGIMSDIDRLSKGGKSADEIAKELKLDVKAVKSVLGETIKELEKNLGMNEEIAFVVRYTDPQNKKRFAIPYKDQKSADDKADQLKKDGVKEIGVTKDVLKPGYKFKEELEETIKIVPVHKSVLPDHLKKLFDKDGNFINPKSQAVFDKMVKDAGGSDAFRKKYNIYKKEDGSVELREFTDAQIKTLEKEYAPLKGKRMSTDMLNRMLGMIKKMSKAQLNKLAQANVPFVTSTAKSELVINRGMKWSDFKESLNNLKKESTDSETSTATVVKKSADKEQLKQDIEKLEKENQLLKVKNLEKTQKTVEPNKDTGEVPLKVGLAQKILKDMRDGKKPKKIKEKETNNLKGVGTGKTKIEIDPKMNISASAGGDGQSSSN